MARYSLVESFDRLEHEFHRCCHAFWAQHLDDFLVYLIHRERRVDVSHAVAHLGSRFLELCETVLINIVNDMEHVAFLQQLHCGTKDTELLQARHVDTVVVGVSYLWRTAHHHNLLWVQAVENLQDALFQSRFP